MASSPGGRAGRDDGRRCNHSAGTAISGFYQREWPRSKGRPNYALAAASRQTLDTVDQLNRLAGCNAYSLIFLPTRAKRPSGDAAAFPGARRYWVRAVAAPATPPSRSSSWIFRPGRAAANGGSTPGNGRSISSNCPVACTLTAPVKFSDASQRMGIMAQQADRHRRSQPRAARIWRRGFYLKGVKARGSKAMERNVQ